ncbi:MAG TPA: hypothetical protein VL966_02295 [Alphaproteobacteria bacterium]|jgi:hypothetical protein|nr:hypothetical protein [Alphaproteobacteria bacterium]
MMGGSKNGAASMAAPTASSRRAVGTIAEAAAIARAGARHEPATPSRESARRDRRLARITERETSEDSISERDRAAIREEGAEDAAPRRAQAVDPAEVQGADGTVTHQILAERAYAYGRSIVEAGPEPKKPGETLEIKS